MKAISDMILKEKRVKKKGVKLPAQKLLVKSFFTT